MIRPTRLRSLSLAASLAALVLLVGCQQKSNEERFLESVPPGIPPGEGGMGGGGSSDPNVYARQGYPGASTPGPGAAQPEGAEEAESTGEVGAATEPTPSAEEAAPPQETPAVDIEATPAPEPVPPADDASAGAGSGDTP